MSAERTVSSMPDFPLVWGPIVHALWDYTRYVGGTSQEPRLLGLYRDMHDAERVGHAMLREDGPITQYRVERVVIQ